MNKGILGAILVVVVVGAVVALFFKNTSPTEQHPWRLLPDTPDMVLESNNPAKLYEKLKRDNDSWKSLTKANAFKNLETQIANLDSLLKSNHTYHDALFSSHLLVAFYGDSVTAKVVMVSSLGQSTNPDKLLGFLKKKLNSSFIVTLENKAGFDVIKITNQKSAFHFTFGFADNMMIASVSEALVLKGLDEYIAASPEHFCHRKSFVKLRKTAGKKVNTRLYLNGGGVKNLLTPIIANKEQEILSDVGTFLQWTEADLFIRKNEIVLNGLSIGKTEVESYQRFLSQKPQNQDFINILPSNTTMFLFQGVSDFKQWRYEPVKSNLLDVNHFSELIGSEIVFVSTARNKSEFDRKSFMVVRFNDRDEAQNILINSAKRFGKTNTRSYGQYKINKLKTGDFCAKTFGTLYGAITLNYFVFIDDYVAFGNSDAELVKWIRYYETGKTLDLNEGFRKFHNNLTETSNLTLFVKIRDFSEVVSRFLNKESVSIITQNNAAIKDFEGLLLQMSSQKPFVYTSLYIKQSEAAKIEKKDISLWKVKLEDDIVGKPYPVKDHTTRRYNIIVFDKSFNVYLIKYNGTILWKKQLEGIPESDVFQVDYFKNGKIQYLFNTAEMIYLIDKNGDFVKKYPLKINPSATNGLSVFDYNKKRDYRIFMAQSDKRVYNYNLKGKKIKGWKNFKMPDIVIKPVQRLVAYKKDYFLITDIKNNTKIVNRKGVERIKIKGKLNKAENSVFYVNRTNRKGILITTDKEGKLVYISSNGLLRYTDFGTFSPNHFFLYEDFDRNGSTDFIYVDGNKLTVFDRFKKILFSYQFKSDIQIKPAFFSLGRNKKVLGIVSDQEKTIYLFDEKGNTIVSTGLLGEIPFTVTSLKNNREINLITGSGNTLFNYKIK